MLSAEAPNTNFIVFGLTRPGLESTIYHTRGEHANHYTTDAVVQRMIVYNILNPYFNLDCYFIAWFDWMIWLPASSEPNSAIFMTEISIKIRNNVEQESALWRMCLLAHLRSNIMDGDENCLFCNGQQQSLITNCSYLGPAARYLSFILLTQGTCHLRR